MSVFVHVCWRVKLCALTATTLVWRRDCCRVAVATRGPRTTRYGPNFCSVYDATGSFETSSSTASTQRAKHWTWAFSWRQYATSIRPTSGPTWPLIEASFHCPVNRRWLESSNSIAWIFRSFFLRRLASVVHMCYVWITFIFTGEWGCWTVLFTNW